MVRRAPRDLGQPLLAPQRGVELVTLPLRRVVLPVGRKGVAQGAVQLLLEPLAALAAQAGQQLLGVLAPVDAAVLLARAADAAHALQRGLLGLEAREDEVDGLEPHGHGREHLALGLVDLHALGQAILGAKVGVEVDLGLGEDAEVGLDHDGWSVV